MPLDIGVTAEELRAKFPGKGVWVDRVYDCLRVNTKGIETHGVGDFTIWRKDIEDNVHVRKCELMFEAIENTRFFDRLAASGIRQA